jgi:hypothetical protein
MTRTSSIAGACQFEAWVGESSSPGADRLMVHANVGWHYDHDHVHDHGRTAMRTGITR